MLHERTDWSSNMAIETTTTAAPSTGAPANKGRGDGRRGVAGDHA